VAAVDLLESPAPRNGCSIIADLSQEDEIERVIGVVEGTLGAPDVIVQCAAVIARTQFLDVTASNIQHVFGINVTAVLLGARMAAESMIKAGKKAGAIVNLSSVSAVAAGVDGNAVVYEASKGAVSMATRSMAVALAPFGIRVNAVAPGSMAKWQEMEPRHPDDLDSFEKRRTPLGRHGVGADIASAVQFLASDDAAYITGSILYVDGGRLSVW
jgi:NAD(P)-dependent dehydrogenase (short-subunit alcohol dehydrogenase family)